MEDKRAHSLIHPQGTAKRWEQVAAYVRTRTVEEVIEMVKHGLKSGKVAGSNVNGIAKKRQVGQILKHDKDSLQTCPYLSG